MGILRLAGVVCIGDNEYDDDGGSFSDTTIGGKSLPAELANFFTIEANKKHGTRFNSGYQSPGAYTISIADERLTGDIFVTGSDHGYSEWTPGSPEDIALYINAGAADEKAHDLIGILKQHDGHEIVLWVSDEHFDLGEELLNGNVFAQQLPQFIDTLRNDILEGDQDERDYIDSLITSQNTKTAWWLKYARKA